MYAQGPLSIKKSFKRQPSGNAHSTVNIIGTCASSEDSDQPAHSHSLIRIFTGRTLASQGCKVSIYGQQRLCSDCADEIPSWNGQRHMFIYSRLSLSRIPRDSLKHFEIPRHIRVERVRKNNRLNNIFNKWICNLTPEVRNIYIK